MNRTGTPRRFRDLVMGFAVLLASTTSMAADISVRAFVDRNLVGVGEQFTLSLELSGSDAGDVAEPAPPDIQTFGSYRGSGTSSSIQIINGQMSRTRTINYYYQALAPGKFEIGPIVVEHDGAQHQTSSIPIEIVERTSRGTGGSGRREQGGISPRDLFVRATASKTRVYQNEAVLLTYKIYTRVNVTGYSLTQVPDKTGFWVEDLLRDQQRPATSNEIVNGVQYTVATVQEMVLFPTSPGEKVLDPLEVECEVQVRAVRRSLFDDFFSDPFGRTVRYSIRSEEVKIEALPLPEAGKPKSFAGAVGQFRLTGGVDKTAVDANEVVTFKIQLEGTGNIRTLPTPETSFSSGLENYDPKVSEKVSVSDGQLTGSRTYEYVLVPRTPGTQAISRVDFPYFDPTEGEYKTASLAEIGIEVAPGAVLAIQAPGASLAKEEVRLLAQEIRFIKLDPGQLRGVDYALHRSSLFWAIALLPVCGVLAGFWYRRHLDRLEGDVAYARSRQAGRVAKKRLAAARSILATMQQQEFYSECGKALLGFVADKLNISEAGIVSDQLVQLLRQRGVAETIASEYLECMKTCDLQRFSPIESSGEEMTRFLQRAEEAIKSLHRELSK